MNIFTDKNVLVTGGTGSIGSAVVQKLLFSKLPKTIRVYSRSEYFQSRMAEELADKENFSVMRFFVGDIRDKNRLLMAMDEIDIVINCSAMKGVGSCAYNPFEAIKTNIIGTQNIIEACLEKDIEYMVNISTDKAVDPISVMGATKQLGEKLVVSANRYKGKRRGRFFCVRLGNVWGSRGSVLPVFVRQARKGKVEVRDIYATRFCITKQRAASFILDVFNYAMGGEVFVPRMDVFVIYCLAVAVRESVNPSAKIVLSVLGEEEKKHEILIGQHEKYHYLQNSKGFKITPYGECSGPISSQDIKPLSQDTINKIAREYVLKMKWKDWRAIK